MVAAQRIDTAGGDAAIETTPGAAWPDTYPPRVLPATWPQTAQSRQAVLDRLLAAPFLPSSAAVRRWVARGLAGLLDWLQTQPGATWQQRWTASGADQAGPDWLDLPSRHVPTLAARPPANLRQELMAMRLLLCGQVIRPSYRWLLRYRPTVLLQEARALIDPAGFARLVAHMDATGRRNPTDRNRALNRITWILLAKGGRVADITVGDCVELDTEQRRYQRSDYSLAPLFYTLLAETGVLPADAPPLLRAARMPGPRGAAAIVDRYGIACAAVRALLVDYLTERATTLDHSSLLHRAYTICGLFWRDLERHHPGIDSLRLAPEVAQAWKKLRHIRDEDGRVVRDRTRVRAQLLIVRSFYLDLAAWAAEDPARWGPWVAPCPITAAECSTTKENKHRKAAMDQRTRARLPVLPALVRTAEVERRAARQRLDAARAVEPLASGWTPPVPSRSARRSPSPGTPSDAGPAAPTGSNATDLATGARRDLTFEDERAFWAWATIEVLRHTGIRIEELQELSHHSFVAYTLPSTGEVVPMLQIAPSKTDTERLLLVAPELGEVLAELIHRVRGGQAVLPLVRGYDRHERVWNHPMPLLFQRPRGPPPRRPGRRNPTPVPQPHPGRLRAHRRRPRAAVVLAPRLPQTVRHRRPAQRAAATHRGEDPRPYCWNDDGIRRHLSRRRHRPPPRVHRPPPQPAPRRGVPRPHLRGVGPVPAPLRAAQGRSRRMHPRLRHPLCARAQLHTMPTPTARPRPAAASGRDPRQPPRPYRRGPTRGLAR